MSLQLMQIKVSILPKVSLIASFVIGNTMMALFMTYSHYPTSNCVTQNCMYEDTQLNSTYQPSPLQPPTNPIDIVFPTIFMITPTYKRLTQKADMIQLCQTLMLVPKLTWIVVEDSTTKTSLITNILEYCTVQSVHLNEKTTTFVSRKKGGGGHRGVDQRNRGLKWIRDNYQSLVSKGLKKGVVYFGDDDNTYDLRLFEEVISINFIPF